MHFSELKRKPVLGLYTEPLRAVFEGFARGMAQNFGAPLNLEFREFVKRRAFTQATKATRERTMATCSRSSLRPGPRPSSKTSS